MHKNHFIKVSLLLLLIIGTSAPIVADNSQPMAYSIKFMNDSARLSYPNIKHLPENLFTSYENQTLYKDSAYWLRLELLGSFIPHQEYIIYFKCMLTQIELYEPLGVDSFRMKKSGVFVPYSQKEIKGHIKDQVMFSLPGENDKILYLRICNQLEYEYNLNNFKIKSIEDHYQFISNVDFFQSFFIGMMIILAIVNFVLFFFSRDRLYLFYSFYLFLIGLFFFNSYQFSERYIFFNYPKLDLLLYWTVYLAQFIYLLFFLQLLKNENIPIWRKYVKYYAWLSFGIYCVVVITGQISYPLGVIVSDFYTLLNVIFIVASFFIFYNRVKRTTKLVLLGTLIMVIGALVTTVIDFSQVSLNSIVYYQLGLFIEFVLFTIAVNYTYVKDRLEKVKVLYKNSLLNLEKQKKEQENKSLQYEIDAKNRGLASKAVLLSEKESLIAELIKKLDELKKKSNDKLAIQGLINNLNHSLSNNSWDEFEKYFNEVHPNFYQALSRKHPNLTASDRKLCAYIKLNFSTKEISNITGKSINTIDVARSRLRKKIGLENKENLQTIIACIDC